MTACTLRLAIALSGLLLLAPAAFAVNQTVEQKWALMDRCTKMALQKYPDNTPDNYAKRDAFARQCQRQSRVPVRQNLAPPGTAQAPGAPTE
ncbi:MAG TPA: hypothetical protein VFA50_15360 [Stellaceae bacterium]|nr:hypothetical protein [Stellaceae bacterium]